ncbi:MAG: carboxypeptidase regulatory-like domain-containing protein, partial [Elusimicrobia bacterium]|nr:carboxypeptidase regulatory-like domain-containing protein [Elusimicrobiota bacterium]
TIAIDQHSNIYTTETNYQGETQNRIQKYDPLGNHVTTINQSYGHSLALSTTGAVYTVSNNSEILKFSPAFYQIKGRITDLNGAGLAEVPVTLSGSATVNALTDSAGVYQFTDLAIGNYTITPAKKGYYFNQENIKISALAENLENQDFAELFYPTGLIENTIIISGQVKDAHGIGLENIAVSLTGKRFPKAYKITDIEGKFVFAVPIIHDAGIYTLAAEETDYTSVPENPTPANERYVFIPPTINLNQVQASLDAGTNIEAQDFMGIPMVVDSNNVKILGGERGYINTAQGEKAQIVVNPGGSGTIEIKIYDLSGNLVWETNKEVTANTVEIITWDGKNNDRERLSSGIYIARVSGGGINQIKKIALIK